MTEPVYRDRAEQDRCALYAEIATLRAQLAASEHMRVKDNEVLIRQRDEARAKALRDAEDALLALPCKPDACCDAGRAIAAIRALLPKAEPPCVCGETGARNCPQHSGPVKRVECDVCHEALDNVSGAWREGDRCVYAVNDRACPGHYRRAKP